MSIRVLVHPYFLRDGANEYATVEVNGDTVGQCLNHLVKQLPAVEKRIFEENGELRYAVFLFVNGEDALPEQLAKLVKDGDEIHVIPLLLTGSGG